MAQIEVFKKGLHSRPFSSQLNAQAAAVEFDYGGKLTAYLDVAAEVDWVVRGVDLSYWQDTLDAAALKKKAQFAVLRYGYGNNTVDGRLANFYPKIKDNGIVPMAYWYIKPGKNIDKHIETFIALLKTYPAKAIFGDVEEDGGFDKNDLHNWLNKYFSRLYEAWGDLNSFNEKQIEDTLGIYTSAGFWNSNMPLTSWAKKLMLWVAHWTTAQQPIIPIEWQNKTWKFWQWSSKGAGNDYGVGSTYVDLNRYYGQVSDFNNQFGTNISALDPIEPPPPPPPPVDPPPNGENFMDWYVKSTTTPYLNVRATAGGADVGDLYPGTEFKIKNVVYLNGAWAQIAEGEFADKWVCLHNNYNRYCEPVGM